MFNKDHRTIGTPLHTKLNDDTTISPKLKEMTPCKTIGNEDECTKDEAEHDAMHEPWE